MAKCFIHHVNMLLSLWTSDVCDGDDSVQSEKASVVYSYY